MARILNDVDSDTATPTREQISSLITYRADDTNLQRSGGVEKTSDEIVSGEVIIVSGSSADALQAEQKAYEDARKKEEEARKAQQAAAESERFGDPNSKVNNGDTNNVTTPPSGSAVTTPPSGSTVTTLPSGSTVTTDGTGQTTTKTDTTDTNPNNQTDSNKKEEAKPKANESPEAAPNKVDESDAMTEEKSVDLTKQNAKQGNSIRVTQGSWYNPTPNPSAKPGGVWAYRKVESNNLSGPPNEFNQQSGPIVAEVKYYFGANWNTLLNGLGSNKPSKQNLIDIPIIMNFPEVGVFNKACPYVAEENTELHMMITRVGNKGGYTYGVAGLASWADKDYWCGHWTSWCELKSGYDGGNDSGAGTANVIGWNKCIANFANGRGSKSLAGYPATSVNGQVGVYNNYFDFQVKNKKGVLERYKWNGRESEKLFAQGYNIKTPTIIKTETIPDLDKKGKQKIDKKGNPVFKTVQKEIPDPNAPKVSHWEQLMSDPIQAIFFVGYHIDKSGGLTAAGKRLCAHFVKECNTECFTLSRGDHVEFGVFLNPDGTLISFGGNTSGALSRNGTNFVIRAGTVGKFGLSNGMTVLTAMKGSGQKVSNKLNSKFIRTPLYNAYSNQIGKDNKLSSAYKQIMDKITV
jgi:hypothetical protein